MDNNICTRERVCGMIKSYLKDNNVTMREFAASVGVSLSSVKRWYDGICAPDINLLDKVCEVMNISINVLLNIGSDEGLTSAQLEVANKYKNDKVFHTLCNYYRDDEKFKEAMTSFLKLLKN